MPTSSILLFTISGNPFSDTIFNSPSEDILDNSSNKSIRFII